MKKDGHTRKLVDPEQMPLHQTGALSPQAEEKVMPWVIEFRVVGTPHIIKQNVKEQMLIGRADDVNNVIPEIDLTSYDAYAKGVSRQHAILQARDNRVTLQDLGSSNGTYINGHMLQQGKAFRVREGDIVTIGKLELQAHFVVKPKMSEKTTVGVNYLSPEIIGNGQSVLIVDEDPYLGKVLAATLKQAGFAPTVVEKGVNAISYLDENIPDIMIVELDLPDISGIDIYRYLKKQTEQPVPTIGISAATAGYFMGQALEEGMEFFIGKPLALDELTNALGKIVKGKA